MASKNRKRTIRRRRLAAALCLVMLWIIIVSKREPEEADPPALNSVPSAVWTEPPAIAPPPPARELGNTPEVSPARPPAAVAGAAIPLPPVTPDAMEPSELYEKTIGSVVWLRVNKAKGQSAGTGVVIGKSLVLTAYHVVDGSERVIAYSPARDDQGDIITAPSYYDAHERLLAVACTVERSDPPHDLAVVRLATPVPTMTPIRMAAASGKPGDACFTIGNSGTAEALWRFTGGSVRQVYRTKLRFASGQNIDARIVESQMPTNPGDSGGPILNRRGELIGINSSLDAKANLVHFGIDVGEVRAFLTKIGPDLKVE